MSNFIHQLRLKENLSQEDVASAIGMSRQTFAQKEQNIDEFTLAELGKLSLFFELSVYDLITANQVQEPEIILEKASSPPEICTKMRDDRPQITVDPSRVEKFKQALLYILSKIGAKPNVGETVLYKLLYFIDFDYYELYEEQILGATYIKNHHGPTPIEMKKIIEQMVKDKQIEVCETKYFRHKQKKYLPLVEPNLSRFSAIELQHIDHELERLANKNAKSLSDFSHKDLPWIMTELGKPIGYEDVFYRTAITSVRVYEEEDD